MQVKLSCKFSIIVQLISYKWSKISSNQYMYKHQFDTIFWKLYGSILCCIYDKIVMIAGIDYLLHWRVIGCQLFGTRLLENFLIPVHEINSSYFCSFSYQVWLVLLYSLFWRKKLAEIWVVKLTQLAKSLRLFWKLRDVLAWCGRNRASLNFALATPVARKAIVCHPQCVVTPFGSRTSRFFGYDQSWDFVLEEKRVCGQEKRIRAGHWSNPSRSTSTENISWAQCDVSKIRAEIRSPLEDIFSHKMADSSQDCFT